MYWYWDNTFLILIPGIVLALFAQFKINGTYAKYNEIRNYRNITGAEAARRILDANGLQNVQVRQISGTLSDNYNPQDQVLNLSGDVYNGTSVSAISIAAHECGHAIQHREQYGPIRVRTALVPVVNAASMLSWILILAGYFLQLFGLTTIGIIFFSSVLLFQLVTLPVEFNASARALVQLESLGIATDTEVYGSKKVLNAAALTYVAATIMAFLQLLRIVLLFGGRRRD